MKVLAPAAGDGGLALVAALTAAAREFNRTLDIRLRFLDIGVDLIPLRPLHGQAGAPAQVWASRVRQFLLQEGPRLVVALAGDPAALSAALEAEERGIRAVVLVPRDEPDTAIEIAERCPAARRHELGDIDDPEEGRRLIEILVAERATT